MARPETVQLELPLPFRQTVTTAPAQICLGGKLVSYTVKRSRRRSIALSIDEHGLRVGAPGRASQHAIEAMLRKHDAWVLRKLAEWQQRRPPPRHWQDGETLMLLGRPLRLTLVPDQPEVCVDGNRFIADSNWARDADKMKRAGHRLAAATGARLLSREGCPLSSAAQSARAAGTPVERQNPLGQLPCRWQDSP